METFQVPRNSRYYSKKRFSYSRKPLRSRTPPRTSRTPPRSVRVDFPNVPEEQRDKAYECNKILKHLKSRRDGSCSKKRIDEFTSIAADNLDNKEAIIAVVEHCLQHRPSQDKLHFICLLDSIARKVGEPFISAFKVNLAEIFASVYKACGPHIRRSMQRILKTWPEVFGSEIVTKLTNLSTDVDSNERSPPSQAAPRSLDFSSVPPEQHEKGYEFHNILKELKRCSQRRINEFTVISADNQHNKEAIIAVIEHGLKHRPPNEKLPFLYLMHSISEKVGEPFISGFKVILKQHFASSYEVCNKDTRRSIRQLLNTWSKVFGSELVDEFRKEATDVDSKEPVLPSYSPPTSLNLSKVPEEQHRKVYEFDNILKNLKRCSQRRISEFTAIAAENLDNKEAIIAIIEHCVEHRPPHEKLPFLCLLDSIRKKVGEPFISGFKDNLEQNFALAYKACDQDTRATMQTMLNNWTNVFGHEIVSKLKCLTTEVDSKTRNTES